LRSYSAGMPEEGDAAAFIFCKSAAAIVENTALIACFAALSNVTAPCPEALMLRTVGWGILICKNLTTSALGIS